MIKTFGSGALPDLMLDRGLLKIIWGGVFLFLARMGGPILISFPNPAGQS